eukprot:TRINITY_DN107065_c0_g1_i1.p1 TRINITY_DN107065_c0_g1~~TRINITY_DN107065_c0_g1_i1.p1  ORF type:complete len:386 (+),score=54.36 TRINITY_DN107065_c0_g1_i1:108-1160(+)
MASPLERRAAVVNHAEKDPLAIRLLQNEYINADLQPEQDLLSEPESQASVDSISGEIGRSWDPGSRDARYIYVRDRAVAFSDSWQPLKWSATEWERRLIAAGSLSPKRKVGVQLQRQGNPQNSGPSVQAAAADGTPTAAQPEESLPAPRQKQPVAAATEIRADLIDKSIGDLQKLAAEDAVRSIRQRNPAPLNPRYAEEDHASNSRIPGGFAAGSAQPLVQVRNQFVPAPVDVLGRNLANPSASSQGGYGIFPARRQGDGLIPLATLEQTAGRTGQSTPRGLAGLAALGQSASHIGQSTPRGFGQIGQQSLPSQSRSYLPQQPIRQFQEANTGGAALPGPSADKPGRTWL